MTGTLPANADLTQLRARAKDLRRTASRGNPAALARVRAVLPSAGTHLTLRDAQLVVAREHGLPGWRELTAAVVAQPSGGRDLHRWFAVELNNHVWDQLDAGLDDTQAEEVLYAAYASTYHWMQAGHAANRGRGEHLIASVAAALGRPGLAARHAARYAELIAGSPAAFEDWDHAFCAEATARAAAIAGTEDAAALRAEAERLTAAVADPEDRRIVEERLAAGPW